MFGSNYILDFGGPAPAAPSSEPLYGPEWDPAFNTPQANGGDNPWAAGYYGPEWDVDANTPQDNGGNNPWAPGYYDSGWF